MGALVKPDVIMHMMDGLQGDRVRERGSVREKERWRE